MHLLFLTTNNLATNPRLYKEIRLAIELNHSCSVVQFKLGNWSDDKSDELKEVVRGESGVVRGERTVGSRERTVVSQEDKVVRGESQLVRSELRGVNAKNRELKFIEIDATSKRKFSWLKWGLLEKLVRWVYPLFRNNLYINALASSRRALQILEAITKTDKPDLIIAHNLGALYPAYQLSQKWNIPFIFDIEDYHPGEFIHHDAKNEKRRRKFLMKSLLPKASAITSASPLIGQYTLKLIGGHSNHTVILNSFPLSEFRPPHSPLTSHISSLTSHNSPLTSHALQLTSHIPLRCDSPCALRNSASLGLTTHDSRLTTSPPLLKLVWFSQKISFGRGLEQLFEALKLLLSVSQYPDQSEETEKSKQKIANSEDSELTTHYSQLKYHNLYSNIRNSALLQLTLIGDLDPEFEKTVLNRYYSPLSTHYSLLISNFSLLLIPPLSQPALHAELANYDIGLALEFDSSDLNRQLCLTNKIIAYAQAGLYILATDTPAQKAFMEEQPFRGLVCGQTPEAMAEALSKIMENKQQIKQKAMARFDKGNELAWEKEREKLSAIWEDSRECKERESCFTPWPQTRRRM